MIDNQTLHSTDIQHLREFFLSGVGLEEDQVVSGTFAERMKNAHNELTAYLKSMPFHQDTDEQIKEGIFAYAGTMQDIHFEMGILYGARLMNTLLSGAESLGSLQAETEGV